MEKIKVLELGINNFGKGGAQTFAWNCYLNFDYNIFHVDFCGVEPNPKSPYIDHIKLNGCNYFNLYDFRNKFISIIRRMQKVNKVAKQNNYDCIHTGDAFSLFLFYISVRKYSKKIIIHSHSSGIENDQKTFKYIIKMCLHKILKELINYKNEKIVRLACSDIAGKWLYPNEFDFKIIKNGIDVSKFIFNSQIRSKIRSELNIENKFVVGHVGRFSFAKNHEFLIDIFNEVYKQNRSAVLLLIGNGPLEDQIREKVNKLGLDNSVIFYGTTPDVNEFYQAMDCFVLPSHFEGMPIVLVEAQTAGLRTVCSDIITNEAKITDLLEYMPLSEPAEKWAEKILSYNNGYKRKDMSKEITAAGFDIKDSAKQLENIYCSFIDK